MRLFDVDDDKFCLVTEHDFMGMDFVWYSSPVNHYDIRETYARIASFDQLEYYAEVFFYLNPDIDKKLLFGLFQWLGNRENGKSVRTYSKHRVSEMIDNVYRNRSTPWCRRARRIIFNPDKIISVEEKLSLAAQVIGRGISYTKEDLINTIECMSRSKILSTQESISKEMGCSVKTIQRLMDGDIKEMSRIKNEVIKRENKIEKAIEWIDLLSQEGNVLKMRYLKEITNVRDYSILKEALHRYENFL